MDESARWLLSKGRKKDAIKVILKMAKTNKVVMKEEDLINLKCEERLTQNSPLRETFKSKIVMRRFLVCLIWWISCTFIAFGLMVNAVSLAGNKYLNFALLSICDIPASFAMVYILTRFHRKKPLMISFLVCGGLCLIQSSVPKGIFKILKSYFFGQIII